MKIDYYEPFDQVARLGEPPWSISNPDVIAWERAHGHDVRIKCYPEFGCQVIESSLERKLDDCYHEKKVVIISMLLMMFAIAAWIIFEIWTVSHA